jgi:hypothetical protein
MDRPVLRDYGKGPERKIQDKLIDFLTLRRWYVKVLHGNAFQQGMPDLFICKREFGYRFVECKQPDKYMFTSAQVETFPKLTEAGVGIWVLTAAMEHEYQKLFYKPNWWSYFTATKIRNPKATKQPPPAQGPEAEIQRRVLSTLRSDGWFCKELHGDLYQYGMPDLFVCKKGFGWRFVEIKCQTGYRFTNAQYESFPRLQSEGVGVWILTSETQVDRLLGPANWHHYLDGARH